MANKLVTKILIIVTKNEISNKNKEKKMPIKKNCRDCKYLLSDNRGWYDCYQRDIYKYSTFPFRYTSCRYFKKKTLLFKILEYFRSKK